MFLKSYIKLFLISLLLPVQVIHAQDRSSRNDSSAIREEYIGWMFQFPDAGENDQERFGKKLVRLIFGRDNITSVLKPVSILARDTNDFWILDQGNGVVFNIKDKVGDIPHFKNKDLKIFPSLVGICSFQENNFLFTDSFLNKIFIASPQSKKLEIFNDSLLLNRPTGIAYSSVNQQIWVVETAAHCISVLDKDGHFIKKIGHRGGAPGEFNFPTYIWIDKFGKIFIVDSMNFRIQVFSSDGELLLIFGEIGDGTGSFARPRGIATDSDGNVYVADALFNTVQIFDYNGNFLYNFGLQGRGKGQFWMPAGIYIDDKDYIYVADTYNSRIQVFKYLKSADK